MGYWHHKNYVRLKQRTLVSHAHIWFGLLVIALGVFNTRLYVIQLK